MFSYLIIFEVNNRFVAFSIDKNFQKSTEIGSQFHNLPTAGYPNPLLLPAGLYHPAVSSNLHQPASSLSFSLRPPLPSVSLLLRPYSSEVTAAASQPPLSPLRPIYPPRPPTRLAQFCVSRARRPAAPTRFFSPPAYITPPCPPTCTNPLLPSLSPCDRLSLPVPRLFLSRRVLMLPQFPSVAPQPRLPSPAASCRRLSTAAFSASAYISAAASDPPRPILRFPRPPAGCPSPLLLPAGLYHPAVSSNLPQPASSLSFSLRPPLPASLPSVSLPPCPHASAVSVRCPSTASSFSRSALPPPLNRCFSRSGGLFDALSLCPISFLQSKKTCRKHVFSFRHFFTACIPIPQQKHPACNRIHPARFRGFSAPTKPASGSICGCRKT